MTSLYGAMPTAGDASLSSRQSRIATRLHTQIGPGPAAFFRDACGLLAADPGWPTTTHLVAHLLREVESAVRSVLEPAGAGADVKSDRQQAKIRAVLSELGISEHDAIAELWLGLTGDKNQQSFASRTHRSALEVPRPANDEFRSFVDAVEQILDAVMDRFETHYIQVFERLDNLLKIEEPTQADAHSLRQSFPHNQVVAQYFFSRASAAWLDPLRQKGFFSAPPPVQVNPDTAAASILPWPESEYLARVAANASDTAVDVTVTIPSTDNNRVHYDVVRVALAVPAASAARLVPTIIDSVNSAYGPLIPETVGELVTHLCRGGLVDEGMALAAALLGRIPAEHRTSRFGDIYEFGIILHQHVPDLVQAAGLRALALLDTLLQKILDADAEHRGELGRQDGSPLWRPGIDGYEHRAESDLRHALVNAIRDAATNLAKDEDTLTAVVTELDSHEWLIFRRLALHTLSQHTGRATYLATHKLTDGETIRDWGLDREYLLLAHHSAQFLKIKSLRRMLTLIDAGPQATTPGAPAPPSDTQRIPDPMPPDRVARWQRNRLAAIHTILPPEWNARYLALVVEHGDAPDPTDSVPEPFAVWSTEHHDTISPSELQALSSEDLVAYLQAWQPPADDRWGLSPASLRDALSAAVRSDAVRRSADADLFIGLPVRYVSAVLDGLSHAAKDGTALAWDSVATLSTWINQQADDEIAQPPESTAHHGWRGPRLDMLRLLTTGLNTEPNPIAPGTIESIWPLITSSCLHPDIQPENKTDHAPADGASLWSLSYDSVRSQGIRTAIAFGLRLRRISRNSDVSQVLALLDRYVDQDTDPARTTRFVFGTEFSRLAWLDPDWAREHVEAIFPVGPARRQQLDAAWQGYLQNGPPSDEVWTMLVDAYSAMVDRLAEADKSDAEASSVPQLGNHLITRLWTGKLSLDNHDDLLRRFYSHLPTDTATDIIRGLGITLAEQDVVDPSLLSRLKALWDFRVSAVRSGADAGELAEFGRWFVSGQFDDEWSLRQLLITMSLAGDVVTEAAVLRRTAELASDRLQPCLAVLERWVIIEPKPWRLSQALDSVRQILTLGLKGNATAKDTSMKVISLLARDHGVDLRDLLSDDPSA